MEEVLLLRFIAVTKRLQYKARVGEVKGLITRGLESKRSI